MNSQLIIQEPFPHFILSDFLSEDEFNKLKDFWPNRDAFHLDYPDADIYGIEFASLLVTENADI